MNWTLNLIFPSLLFTLFQYRQMMKHTFWTNPLLFQLQEKVRCDTKRVMLKNRTTARQITNKTKSSAQ